MQRPKSDVKMRRWRGNNEQFSSGKFLPPNFQFVQLAEAGAKHAAEAKQEKLDREAALRSRIKELQSKSTEQVDAMKGKLNASKAGNKGLREKIKL